MIYPCDHLLVWPRLRFLRFRAEGVLFGIRDLGRQAKSGSERVGICGCEAPHAGA